MPAGAKPGERRGGRQKGTRNHASIARQALVASSGVTPLDVLLEGMRFHHDVAKLAAAAKPDPDIKAAVLAMKEAGEFAKAAAPYVHPKLAATELTGRDGGPIEMKDVAVADRARALAAFVAKTRAEQK